MARVHPEIYFFGADVAEGRGTMRELLGGKGADLHEMASLKLPVPPGFTISTRVCTYFYTHGGKYPAGLKEGVAKSVARIEKAMGRRFGDAHNPLLVSVRSGARVSMPGMMDTVLNLGLTDETVKGLEAASQNARFAWDSYRRFCQMYGDVVLKLKPENKNDPDPFEELIDRKKALRGVIQDVDLTADDLKELVGEFRDLIRARTGQDVPQDPRRAVVGGDRRGVRVVEQRSCRDLPQAEQHPGRLGHGGDRAIDGLRQPRRRLRNRRRLHARSVHWRKGHLRRVSPQCSGRGRGRRNSHAAPD